MGVDGGDHNGRINLWDTADHVCGAGAVHYLILKYRRQNPNWIKSNWALFVFQGHADYFDFWIS